MLCAPQAKELAYLHCGDFFLFFIWIAARQYLQNLPVEAQVMFLQTSFKFLMDVLRLLISPRSPGCSDVLLSGRPSALLLYFSFKWVNVLDLRFKEALHVIMVMLKFLYPLLCITQHLSFSQVFTLLSSDLLSPVARSSSCTPLTSPLLRSLA